MNIFHQIIKSLYSPNDIAKFRFQGIGKTILFIFVLTLISIVPSSYFFTTAIYQSLEVTEYTLKNEVPPFVIENGVLSLNSDKPITILKDEFKIIFDSTGTIEDDDLVNTDNVVAFLKEELIIIAGGQTQATSYAMFSDITLTNEELLTFLGTLKGLKMILLTILVVVIYIFSSGIKFIEVSVLAVIGIILTSLLSRNVPYRQLWRMAAYSVTLPTIIFMLIAALQITVPYGFLINWFVSIMVLGFALKKIPVRKKKEQHA